MRLFGVQIYAASSPMKKSFSMDCLSSSCFNASSSPSPSSSSSSLVCIDEASVKISNGYLSDGLMGSAQERKKGEKLYVPLIAWKLEDLFKVDVFQFI